MYFLSNLDDARLFSLSVYTLNILMKSGKYKSFSLYMVSAFDLFRENLDTNIRKLLSTGTPFFMAVKSRVVYILLFPNILP